MQQSTIVVKPVKRIDRSAKAERELEQLAAISARLGGYKNVRAFRYAAMLALVETFPPSPAVRQEVLQGKAA